MGGGVSQPQVKERGDLKWSVRNGQSWDLYEDESVPSSLTDAFYKGKDTITEVQTPKGMFSFDLCEMVEIEVATSKRRQLRCEYSGTHPPKRPTPLFETYEVDEFESHMLSFLVSNNLRFSDIFHEIDHDRNGWLTRWEVHSFFVNNVWAKTNPEVTKYIFGLMEIGGDIGRVSFHSFSHAVEDLKRVNAFESIARTSSVRNKNMALKQSRAAIAASPSVSPCVSPSGSISSQGYSSTIDSNQFNVTGNSFKKKYRTSIRQSVDLSSPVDVLSVNETPSTNNEETKEDFSSTAPLPLSTSNNESPSTKKSKQKINNKSSSFSSRSQPSNLTISAENQLTPAQLNLSCNFDSPTVKTHEAVRIPIDGILSAPSLEYKTKDQFSPRGWVSSSWYWRLGEEAQTARRLSALACSKSHELLMLNSQRNHHSTTTDGEKVRQQKLLQEIKQLAEEVKAVNNELESAVQEAVNHENEMLKKLNKTVSNIEEELYEVNNTLNETLMLQKNRCRESSYNASSTWESIEEYRANIHILKKRHENAVKRVHIYKNYSSTQSSSSPSVLINKVRDTTSVLIEATALMAQAKAEAHVARIDLSVVESQHVVSFNEPKKNAHVNQTQAFVDEAEEEEAFACEDFSEALEAVEEVLQALHKQNEIITPDYIDIAQLRLKVSHLFDGMEGRLAAQGGKKKGDRGYYAFCESSLGQTIFNERGTVSPEFRSRQLDIAPYREHLSGDRPAWGGLLTAIFNQWVKSPAQIRSEAKASLRYVVFDGETRALGFTSLLREDWASLVKDKKAYKEACLAASKRFKMSKHMNDSQGVDFFVSHNWCDENAPYRWASLVKLSDLFYERFGRLPRFWLDRFCIDQSRQEDIAAKTAFLPATIMSCNFVIVLQSPQYMGCSSPPCSLPSLWCIMEFFTLCTLAPAHDPTTNLLWIPLFKSKPVPPKLDLLHGRVYCFSDEDKARLLSQLASCPGGLVEVQRAMAAVWPLHFRSSYAEWALLSQAAGDGDADRVQALLSNKVSVDLPFEWSPSSSLSTIILVAAAMLHEQWRVARRKQAIKDGILVVDKENGKEPSFPRWKPIDPEEYLEWFVPGLHTSMVKRESNSTCDATSAASQVSTSTAENIFVDINQPFGLLPPSWQAENEKQARAGLDVLRLMPHRDMEVWAEAVHDSWLSRRVEENNGVVPAWVVDANIHVPYAELSEEEKEKDRVVVRTVLYLRTDLGANKPESIDLGASLPRMARSPPSSPSSGGLHEQGSDYSACQPLQAAVFRYLSAKKLPPPDPKTPPPPSARKTGRLASVQSSLNLVKTDSCLSDKCIKLLVDAGADTLDAINQPIIGDEALEDDTVFRLLEDLLQPLYRNPPHCLSLTHNRLSTTGATRLLRFQLYVNEKAKRGLSPPLVSLCGLTPQAIRANWPADLDDNGDDLIDESSDDNCSATDKTILISQQELSNEMLRFQAVNQPNLRAASFTLLLAELSSPPHVNTLTCLDLSSNSSLAVELVRFAPFTSLKRINLERCSNVSGSLEPFVACCTKLTHIKLAYTAVNGFLPTQFGVVLPELRLLDISSTRVSGDLNSLYGASELETLKCASVKGIKGKLFPALDKCKMLKVLDLSSTSITGSLRGAHKLVKLEFAILEHCKFLSGSIVPLSDCRQLREININLTNLSGGASLAVSFKDNCRFLRQVRALHCPQFLYHNDDVIASDDFVDGAAGSSSPTLRNAAHSWRKSSSISINPSQFNALLKQLKHMDVAYTD